MLGELNLRTRFSCCFQFSESKLNLLENWTLLNEHPLLFIAQMSSWKKIKFGLNISRCLNTKETATFVQQIVLIIYFHYSCHLHRFLYHAQWNIFFTFPDDAVDQRKLGIKRITVAQDLSWTVYLTIQHVTERQLQTFTFKIFRKKWQTNSWLQMLFKCSNAIVYSGQCA